MHTARTAFLLMLAMAAMAGAAEPQRRLAVGGTAPPLAASFIDGAPAPPWSALESRVVVIDFWASWCGPCVGNIGRMNALEQELEKEPVKFFAISYEPAAKVRKFLGTHPMRAEVLVDDDLRTFTSFIAWGIPMVYIVGRDGRIAAIVHPDDLTADVIRSVLSGRAPAAKEHPGWPDPAGAAKYFREQLEEDLNTYGATTTVQAHDRSGTQYLPAR